MVTNDTSKLLTAVANLTDEVAALKTQVSDLRADVTATKELVEAWTTVKTMGRFIKWASSIATGLAALWLLAKVGLLHFIGSKP